MLCSFAIRGSGWQQTLQLAWFPIFIVILKYIFAYCDSTCILFSPSKCFHRICSNPQGADRMFETSHLGVSHVYLIHRLSREHQCYNTKKLFCKVNWFRSVSVLISEKQISILNWQSFQGQTESREHTNPSFRTESAVCNVLLKSNLKLSFLLLHVFRGRTGRVTGQYKTIPFWTKHVFTVCISLCVIRVLVINEQELKCN